MTPSSHDPAYRHEDGEYRTACDDGHTDGIDRRADSLDDLDEDTAVVGVTLAAAIYDDTPSLRPRTASAVSAIFAGYSPLMACDASGPGST